MTATTSEPVALLEIARHHYLTYALSVITSRALPDVRDGLKPVQRRILYAMFANLRLLPDARYRKSAAVIGEVMAKYHPHGDSSIYDALVRIAQPFSLLHPLVDGQGNFGSLDGDNAAAMRYTECRLRPIAVELLSEIKKQTVDFRPNYDGQFSEPVVLPAQLPQMLLNGCEGIAVGMATRIPPHNLRELIDACVLLIDQPAVDTGRLCRVVKGPDFPTGGVLLNTREELLDIYENGQGPLKVRGTWQTEREGRKHRVVITSIPYAVNKAALVEKIGALVAARKLPQVVDVRDESTDEVRVVLDLRRSGDDAAALAYLLRHTPLQNNFHLNLTCLVPTPDSDIASPQRCDLHDTLRYWLDFRFQTVRRRIEFDLEQLQRRIHILEGLARIFDALDEAIALIRASENRRHAAERLMARFDLDEEQTDAILDLRLYRLARLQIAAILEELADKRAEAARLAHLLEADERLWAVVRAELRELRKLYGQPRRTAISRQIEAAPEYNEDAYIVAETCSIIVTRDGSVKRQGRFTDLEKVRIREGDTIGWVARASTVSAVTFFTDRGGAFVTRVESLPATSGYGEPIQARFRFADGERVVGVVVHDARALPTPRPPPADAPEGAPTGPFGVAVSRWGRVVRFPLAAHSQPSTRNGRRYMRNSAPGDAVIAVWQADGTELVSLATSRTRGLCFPVTEAKLVQGASKGVSAIAMDDGDSVLAFELTTKRSEGCRVITSTEREEIIRPTRYQGKRGSRGKTLLKRGRYLSWTRATVRYDTREEPG